MAAFLALVSAMCFALAAASQQRGQFTPAHAGSAVWGLAGPFRLVAVPVWLLGTLILPAGHATQGVALGRGRLVVVQPLMVTTIVWALPLGYWLTSQHVVRRQVLGAGVVVVGLAMFVLVGDPDAGVDDASALGLVTSVVVISAVVVLLMLWLRTATAPSVRAAVLGLCSGLLFGLLSPATGQLAPAMAAVSVADPAISVILGILLLEERLTRPGGHVVVAGAALVASPGGAVLITLANRDTQLPASRPAHTALSRMRRSVDHRDPRARAGEHGAPNEPRGRLRNSFA